MKRLALLVAAVVACVLFTACPDKPNEDVYYSEDIALHWQVHEQGLDTTMYYCQEFTMNGNTLIYDPSSAVNKDRPYVYWSHLDNHICAIVDDTIIYFNHFDADHLLGNNLFGSIRAKVNWSGKKREGFQFSYVLPGDTNCIITATHKCRRINSLSN